LGRRTSASTSQVINCVIVLFLFPECEVLLEQLNDALSVTEVVFLELVNLVESRLKGGIRKLTSLGMILKNFVVEHREVKGQAEFDRVACREVDSVGLFIGCLSLIFNFFKFGVLCVFSNVAIVVANHLHKEGLGLI